MVRSIGGAIDIAPGMSPQQRYAVRRRRERFDRIIDERAKRISPSAIDCALMIGLLEGEGTVTIAHSQTYTRPIVTLTSTDRDIIEWINARWPGHVRTKHPNRPQHKTATIWTLQDAESIWRFIDDMWPYAITARMIARLGLLIEDVEQRCRGSRAPKYREHSFERLARMRILNKRGAS